MERLVAWFVVLTLVTVPGALAQSNTTGDVPEEEAGIAPDSLLYFFDRLLEKLELALAMSEEEKIKVRLKHAEERLAEIKVMQKKKKPELIVELSAEYRKEIEEVEREIEEAEKQGRNITEVKVEVVRTTARHLETLEWVYDLVPPEAKPAIEHALNASLQGYRKIKMEIEAEEGELEIEIEGEGFEIEVESRIPEEERARAGKQRDGDGEGKIEAEVKGNTTKVEVELPGVEYEFSLNTTEREEIVSRVANLTGLTPAEVEQLLRVEVETPEREIEVEVEREEEERSIEIEVEREEEDEEEEAAVEVEIEVEVETGGAAPGGFGAGGRR
ncbi:MAG: hypothetical protein GXO66_07355 [Euryarchaeota archaeon]|nr:hypothetical protein [Euryarchaeota archaeon]